LQGGQDTVEEVFETTFFFMLHDSREIQLDTLNSLGFICIRHYVFMLESKLRQLYLDILMEDFYPVQHKIKVNSTAQFALHVGSFIDNMDNFRR
jgi:cohesin loading factor subunit SCC2